MLMLIYEPFSVKYFFGGFNVKFDLIKEHHLSYHNWSISPGFWVVKNCFIVKQFRFCNGFQNLDKKQLVFKWEKQDGLDLPKSGYVKMSSIWMFPIF